MDLKKVLKYLLVGGPWVIILALIWMADARRISYDKQLTTLRNEIAEKNKTIEIQDNVYKSKVQYIKELHDQYGQLIDSKNDQLEELGKEIKKNKEQILTLNSAVVKWKKAYEGLASANQTDVPEGDKVRKKVNFNKDFGYIGVSGHTLTDPAEAYVKVEQLRPLKITMAVTQAKDRTWNVYTTSSEDNVGIDITLAGVSPYVFEKRWYENIGISAEAGLGDGVLAGVGASYSFGSIDVGPRFWLTATDKVDRFYGAGFIWRPFTR